MIHSRGNLPLLVGGTGQYVMAVIEGWGIPRVPPNIPLRRQLELVEPEELARWLSVLDPQAAQRIDSRNLRRVIRALEVTLVSGRPISELQRKTPPPYDMLVIGLDRGREQLYERIDRRVDSMISEGLVEEVVNLSHAGFGSELPAMSGLGYRQVLAYLRGEMNLDEATDRIKFETHRFARQQATWFRMDDPRISWFDAAAADCQEAVAATVAEWLAQESS